MVQFEGRASTGIRAAVPKIVLLLIVAFAASGSMIAATTHYIAANGLDSNDGTSKATPWLHAPGMTNCSSNCASYSPVPGDSFIFRGGDIWHYSSGAPVGLPWEWTWSGATGNNIYIGIDSTWYSGSSWSRPVLTMDNPLSSTLVSSCAYDDTNRQAVVISASYVAFDNFEFTGKCWAGNPFAGSLNIAAATHTLVEHSYFHGWSTTPSAVDTHYMILGATENRVTYNELAYNVIDGSDALYGTTTAACVNRTFNGPPCVSGFGIYGEGYNVHDNILRYLSNGLVGILHNVHDNTFEHMWNSFDGQTHPNVVESTGQLAGLTYYFYNNVIRYTHQNVTYWPEFDGVAYEFNNLFYQNDDGGGGSNVNCFMQSPATSGGSPVAYIYNNTIVGDDASCTFRFFTGNPSTPVWNGTANFENNHFIGSVNNFSGLSSCPAPAVCRINDNGGEVYQTVTTANTQGYTLANMYRPTATGNATVGAGSNLTSSCAAFSSDSALCSGTSDGVTKGAENVADYPEVPVVLRPSTGSWNAGAYQLGGATPAPPTALTAIPK
jgi:hypothetical protein